jgi:hypothetical protein
MSSAEALYSMARTASEIISPALGPIMWTPLRETKIKSVSQSQSHKRRRASSRDDAQDLVGLLLNDHLDETLGVANGLCSRVGGEGELSNLVRDLGSLELLLGLSNPCDLAEQESRARESVLRHSMMQ